MTLQTLHLDARISIPQPAGLVGTGGDDLVALRIELDLTNLAFVALQQSCAGSTEHVIDSSHSVSRGRG